jgi:DNA-binding NarL/FixJ family response regulator
LRWRDFTGLLGPALALAATVHAQLGDRSSAQALLDALAPAHRDDIKVRLQSAEAQAWLAVGQGDSQEAVEVLAATVRQGVEAGHGLLASLTATVALRLDGAEQVVDTLRAAADVSGSRLTALILSAAEMQIAGDARGVVDHAPELTAAGLGALAHELVSRVPGWAPDDRMLVRRARVYANELALTVSSPLSVPGIRDDVGLTEREWMVATAAARRERSREIAERLGVSVRTVDNHLSNIYRKLGVRSRSELEQELREIL